MSFNDIQLGHVRLVILRFLNAAPGYSANAAILHDALKAYGLQVGRDTVRAQIAWLDEQDLLDAESLGNGVIVATLKQRGSDVAEGQATHPGVRRPRARD